VGETNETTPTKPATSAAAASRGASSIDHDVLLGLIYVHNRANANTAEVHEANATLHALVDLLVERGLVDNESLAARRKQASHQLRQEYLERGMAVAMQEFGVSKYDFKGAAEIDCESRIHLCKAACCRLPFALSKEDVQEGIVKWTLGQPYLNARNGDGDCAHLERGTCRCSIYNHRPIPCRGYDCRKDQRIWVNFEEKVINPRVADPDWPQCLETQIPSESRCV
jgi:Fe-S-cluster containining protein